MKMNFIKKQLSFILCMMLITALMLCASGCSSSKDESPAAPSSREDADFRADGGVVGEGSTQFDLTVTDQDGGETQFEVHTDKATVGEALQELGLIDGDDSG